MANDINFGQIYASSHWGIGVLSNSIGWGTAYLTEASNSL
jgi:hypothetical protein